MVILAFAAPGRGLGAAADVAAGRGRVQERAGGLVRRDARAFRVGPVARPARLGAAFAGPGRRTRVHRGGDGRRADVRGGRRPPGHRRRRVRRAAGDRRVPRRAARARPLPAPRGGRVVGAERAVRRAPPERIRRPPAWIERAARRPPRVRPRGRGSPGGRVGAERAASDRPLGAGLAEAPGPGRPDPAAERAAARVADIARKFAIGAAPERCRSERRGGRSRTRRTGRRHLDPRGQRQRRRAAGRAGAPSAEAAPRRSPCGASWRAPRGVGAQRGADRGRARLRAGAAVVRGERRGVRRSAGPARKVRPAPAASPSPRRRITLDLARRDAPGAERRPLERYSSGASAQRSISRSYVEQLAWPEPERELGRCRLGASPTRGPGSGRSRARSRRGSCPVAPRAGAWRRSSCGRSRSRWALERERDERPRRDEVDKAAEERLLAMDGVVRSASARSTWTSLSPTILRPRSS